MCVGFGKPLLVCVRGMLDFDCYCSVADPSARSGNRGYDETELDFKRRPNPAARSRRMKCELRVSHGISQRQSHSHILELVESPFVPAASLDTLPNRCSTSIHLRLQDSGHSTVVLH